jgi:cobalt-zinc-cadmium efflux system outer membrane protein
MARAMSYLETDTRQIEVSMKSSKTIFYQSFVVCSILLLRVAVVPAQFLSSVPTDAGAGRPAESDPVVTYSKYVDPVNGVSIEALVERALTRNAELLAARQHAIEAQGLLLQAGLRLNPGIEVSVTNGDLFGSAGEREISLGYAYTFELGGKRDRRVEVAQLELELTQLGIADRERQLKADIKMRYGEALAAARNLETAMRLLELNRQSYRITVARVNEGEAAAYERGLLHVEINRLESERLLFENQLTRAVLELKTMAGANLDEELRLKSDLATPAMAMSVGDAIERAQVERPDLKAARLEERIGDAEIRLARAEAVPDLIGFTRYTRSSARFDQFGLTASGALAPLRDTDHTLTAGLSLTLPTRNRNQGRIQAAAARREAAALRRQFIEQIVRRDVRAAAGRYEAARRALAIFDQNVIGQSQDNLRIIRAGYELGELRLLDVLNEQRRLIDTQKAYTDVLKECYLALVELERAVGAPLK